MLVNHHIHGSYIDHRWLRSEFKKVKTVKASHILLVIERWVRSWPRRCTGSKPAGDYKAPSTPATMSKQQGTLSKLRSTLSKQHWTLLPQTATTSNDFIVKFRPFDRVETNWTCSNHCCQKRQQCRSNIRHCRKNRSTCSIRQCCFDIVAGMDGA